MWFSFVFVFFVVAWLRFSEEACHDFIYEQQKIVPPPNSNKRYFGSSLVLTKGYLIIGSQYDSEGGFHAGAAHVYKKIDGNWTHQAKLIPSNGRAYGECGSTLAADGDKLLMGCPSYSSNGVHSGSVYVFNLSNGTWIETQSLKTTAFFGSTLSMNKNAAVVNSIGKNLANVFETTSGIWKEVAKVKVLNASNPVQYGDSVSIFDSHIAVGRPFDSENDHQSGSVNIFRNVSGNWTLVTKIQPRDGSHGDYFGMYVAIGKRFLVVSSHGDDGNGLAYIYENIQGQWKEGKKLTPCKGASDHAYGHPVVLNGNTIAIGCMDYVSNTHYPGGVYVFQRINNTEWIEAYKCLPSDGEYNGMFGYSIDVEGDTIAVSSVKECLGECLEEIGSVYIFKNIDLVANGSILCDPPQPAEVKEMNLALTFSVSIPIGILLLVFIVACVYKIGTKFPNEKVEDKKVYYILSRV